MNHPANMGKDVVLKVAERVRHLASESAYVAIEKVQLNSRLIQDLGLDSLAMTEFLMAIEDECGLHLPIRRFRGWGRRPGRVGP